MKQLVVYGYWLHQRMCFITYILSNEDITLLASVSGNIRKYEWMLQISDEWRFFLIIILMRLLGDNYLHPCVSIVVI